MSRRGNRAPLLHMLDYSREALQFTEGVSKDELVDNRLLSLAVVRLLEIIGEAANRIDSGYREKHSEISWSRIIGMRNRLIHGYDIVDFDVVWQSVTEDLPPLIEALEIIIHAEEFQ